MKNGSPGNCNQESAFGLALYHPLASFLAGFRFLTILPVSWMSNTDGRFFKASLLWFPAIGAVIGLLAAMLIWFVSGLLPSSVLAFFGILVLAALSGCLHLDGLADSCDGLLSSRPRGRALEIMRDSHAGVMGVIALVFILLGKYAALSSMPKEDMAMILFIMPVAGRTAIVLMMAVLPYARTGDGLGKLFYSGESRGIALSSLIFFLIITSLLYSLVTAVTLFLTMLATAALFSLWCYLKLGGATGDTLGAVCECTELTVAVTFCVLSGIN